MKIEMLMKNKDDCKNINVSEKNDLINKLMLGNNRCVVSQKGT